MGQSGDNNSAKKHESSPVAAVAAAPPLPPTDMERKLQLLECRFTMPLPHGASNPATSPATLDPENSSPDSFPLTHPNNSHSFGFDTPSLLSLSRPSESKRISSSPPPPPPPHATLFEHNHGSTIAIPTSHTPEWQKLALQHMEKIASQQPHELDSQSQDRTLLTSHVETVKEPTPAMSSQSLESPSARSNSRKNVPKSKLDHKRKSVVPSKRNHHSVKDSLLERCTAGAASTALSPRKRARLEASVSHERGAVPKSPRLMGSPKSPHHATTGTGKQGDPKGNVKKPNHAKISDFFTSNRTKPNTKSDDVPGIAKTLPNPTTPVQDVAVASVSTNPTSTAPNTTWMPPKDLFNAEFESLQRRCQELEQICQDKEEQLKAVANNRTIQHSALQSALRQRQDELDDLREATDAHTAQTRAVLEEWIRSQACRLARDVRHALATDSARLGRLVAVPAPHTRGPPRLMRSVVESWEDGHATQELAQKRRQLHEKRIHLEERLRVAERRSEQVSERDSNGKASNNQNLDPVEENGPLPTLLDAVEAVESARFHLDSLRQEEEDLAQEERSLQDQKGTHIRALKRVANEDASRFHVRPKLNDRYVLCGLLGKGGFSEVWRAYDMVEFREVAVKIHELDARWPESKKENYTKHVSREYEIHRNVRHPRIVSLYDVFEIDNNSFATVLESCDGTDLDALLKLKRRLPERDARVILLQILSGMNYLSHPSSDGSRQGIIHYDLKPGNILFDKYGDAKITDFGLSKIVESGDPAESMELTSQGAGTYWYLPPECFVVEENVRISNKVDVWSIGVIHYQMLYGKRPFGDGQSQDRILTDGTMLNAHTVVFPDTPTVTEACKEFIRACLTYDQKYRLSIAQLCQHPYVVSQVGPSFSKP